MKNKLHAHAFISILIDKITFSFINTEFNYSVLEKPGRSQICEHKFALRMIQQQWEKKKSYNI